MIEYYFIVLVFNFYVCIMTVPDLSQFGITLTPGPRLSQIPSMQPYPQTSALLESQIHV